MPMTLAVWLCIFLTVITTAFYNIFLKQYKDRLVLLFWVEIFTYIWYLLALFFKKHILGHDTSDTHKMIFDLTYTNLPLYLLMALCFVSSLIFLNHLLKKYEISLVIPLSQISLLIAASGYILLGDPFQPAVLIGICIICFGAFLSSLTRFSLKDLNKISGKLILDMFLYATLVALTLIITYQTTQQTHQTQMIQQWFADSFKSLHTFHFYFYNPFYFNIGVRFFIMLFFIIAFYVFEKKTFKEPFIGLKKHPWFIIKTSLVYFASLISYYYAYNEMINKNILSGLFKLTIPTILILSILIIKEKAHLPKIIGAIIIVLGGAIAVAL